MKTLPELIAEAAANVRRIPVKDALVEIEGAQTPLLIDVREPAEAAQTPNPGAEVIPRGVLEMQMLNREIPADTPIYLHCATGGRATLAAEQLQRIGFTHVTAISCPIATIVNAQ